MEIIHQDLVAERSVLAGIYTYGENAYIEVADVIQQPTAFMDETNQALYKCFSHLIEKKGLKNLDQSSVLSASGELGYSWLFEKPEQLSHVKTIFNSQIRLENVRLWAAKIRKLQIARMLRLQLETAIVDVNKINGSESVDAIVGIAENAVFDFSELINTDGNNEPVLIGSGLRDYLRERAKNPVEQIGLSSGMKYYDAHIGGGFRRKGVSLVGARTGVGKSMLSDNIGLHIASNGVPVLYLDTEMNNEDHWHRLTANLADITIRRLETGKFGESREDMIRVGEAIDKIEEVPFHYLNISGKPFEEIISIMRRWVTKYVPLDDNGKRKDCIIIYDYVKSMSSEGISAALQEYQLLGFMMTGLHNFAVKYDIPALALVQLNRDGIDKETTDVVSGSDRVTWLATNLAVFKPKSDDEIAADQGEKNGTHKLVIIKARHGSGTPSGDYINVLMEGDRGRIKEKETHFNLKKRRDSILNAPPAEPPPEVVETDNIPFAESEQ